MMKGMMTAVMGAIAFLVVKEVVRGIGTSGWSTIEVTMVYTLLPLAIAIGAVFTAFKLMGFGPFAGGKG